MAVASLLHELGHVLFVLASGGRITSLAFSFDPARLGILMSHQTSVLADAVNGYFGGSFAAAVMLLLYMGMRGRFVRKSLWQTAALGMAWFAAIGLSLSQAVAEGAFRQLYLGSALFDNITGIFGMMFGIVAYCRYVFVPSKSFKPRNALVRMMFGR
ncbi:MAG: hypothetical protein ABIA12_02405 [Candidatus Aenigmatarchaeota archaeon]